MNKTKIVMLGAGYAGILAAVRLAGKTKRLPVEITLVNGEAQFVERLRLHQFAANQSFKPRPITDMLRNTGIRFVQGWVTGIDLAIQRVSVQTADGLRELPYDNLFYALGSRVEQASVSGLREYAYTLNPTGERSAGALREALMRLPAGARLVICGGGATGVEAAAEFAETYLQLEVQLITRGSFGAFSSQTVADYMRQSLERRGVVIYDQTIVTALEARQVVTATGETYPYDVCLWAGGFTVPALAREAGLAVNESGQIILDPFMRSISHPNVYAAGDAAVVQVELAAPLRMSAYTAVVTGAHAADCVADALRGRQSKPLSFTYAGQGIALGRQDGIGFGLAIDDRPKGPYFRGKAGLNVREFFVNLLGLLPGIERRIPGFFFWTGKGRYKKMLKQDWQQQTAA